MLRCASGVAFEPSSAGGVSWDAAPMTPSESSVNVASNCRLRRWKVRALIAVNADSSGGAGSLYLPLVEVGCGRPARASIQWIAEGTLSGSRKTKSPLQGEFAAG